MSKREVPRDKPEDAEPGDNVDDSILREEMLKLVDSVYSKLKGAKFPDGTQKAFEVALLEYRDCFDNSHIEDISMRDWITLKKLRAALINEIMRSIERIMQYKATAHMNRMRELNVSDRIVEKLKRSQGIIENAVLETGDIDKIVAALKSADKALPR